MFNNMNNYIINIIKNKQLLYSLIYNLKLKKLKNIKNLY